MKIAITTPTGHIGSGLVQHLLDKGGHELTLLCRDPEKVKQFQDAQNQLSGALGRLIAVSEAYPDLKSNQNFLALQSQLEGTENRIAVARRDYVAAVRDYNLTLSTFPSIIWAKTIFAGNKPMAAFTASEGSDKPPQVKF